MTEEERKVIAIAHESMRLTTNWSIFTREDRQTCLDAVPKLLADVNRLEGADSLLDELVAALMANDDDAVDAFLEVFNA